MFLCIIIAVNIVTEPNSATVTVNQATQFICRAYIEAGSPELTVSWYNAVTGLALNGNIFTSTNETFETSGIVLVTSVLSFSGSNQPTSYSLLCLASALEVNDTSQFTLSVIGSGKLVVKCIICIMHAYVLMQICYFTKKYWLYVMQVAVDKYEDAFLIIFFFQLRSALVEQQR